MIKARDFVYVIDWCGANPLARVMDIDAWGFAHVMIGSIIAYVATDRLQLA